MKEKQKEAQLKDIRRVAERINELFSEMRNTPPTVLEKKIFAGHWRFITVREDVLRSSIGEQVKKIVDQCNHWVLGDKKKEESYRASTETRLGETTCSWSSGQGLHPLTEDQWEKSNLPEHFKKKWFDTYTYYIRAGTKNIPKHKYFPNIPKHMLEFDYKKGYITEIPTLNPDAESELAHLRKYMENNRGWERLGEASYRRDDWGMSLDKKKKLKKIANKESREELKGEEI